MPNILERASRDGHVWKDHDKLFEDPAFSRERQFSPHLEVRPEEATYLELRPAIAS